MSFDPPDAKAAETFVLEMLLAEVLADVEAGREPDPAAYTARFPGHAALIESELRRLAGAPPPGSAAPPIGGEGVSPAAGAERAQGRYRLLEERGRGGQGAVYVAEDTALGRQVAIKVLSGLGSISQQARLRFVREATALSKLDHPGICPVFDFGEDESGLFIVMALLRGMTLARAIRESPPPAAPGRGGSPGVVLPPGGRGPTDPVLRILWTVESVARALHHAHEHGLVHRDIKPDNVMLTDGGQPVLLDFGLAYDGQSESATLTRSGELMGTPAYLAPEQIRAVEVGFDPRSDVYALGVTLFECLTLQRPFQAATREGLYHAILTWPVPRALLLEAGLAPDVVVVLETALSKEVDRRYQSALALAEDLRRIRNNLPIAARQPSVGYRIAKFTQRHKAVVGGIAATIVALSIGLVGMAFLWREATVHAERARWQAYRMGIIAAADAIGNQEDQRARGYLEAAPRAHRGFEWGYLRERARRWQRDLVAPAAIVDDLCVDPSRRELLAVLADRGIAVWSAPDWTLRSEEPFDGDLSAIADRVVNDAVALGTPAGEVLHWRRDTGEVECVVEGAGSAVTALRTSLDGSHLVVGRGGETLLVRIATGEIVQRFAVPGSLLPVPLAATGSSLGWSDGSRYSRWLADSGLEVGGFDSDVPLTTMAATPDGAIVALGTTTDVVILLQALPNFAPFRVNVLARLLGHRGAVVATRFSFDGRWLVSVGEDRSLRVWDVSAGNTLRTVSAPDYWPAAAVISPDRAFLVSRAVDDDRSVRLWPVRPEPAVVVGSLPACVRQLAVSADGAAVAAAPAGEGVVRVWRIDDAALLGEARGELAAVAGTDWLRSQPAPELRPGGGCSARSLAEVHVGAVRCVAYTPDGRRLASGSDDTTIRIWDTATGEPLIELRGHAGPVTCVVFSADGTRLLSGSEDRTVRLWWGRPHVAPPTPPPRLVAAPPAPSRAAEASTGEPGDWVEHIVSDRTTEACYARAVDIDGDGDLDILSAADAEDGADEIAWHEQTEEGFRTHVIERNTGSPRCVLGADLDDDGDTDIVASASYTGNISWYENLGGSPARLVEHTITAVAASVYRIDVADVDGDGLPDVLSASQNDDTVAWFANDGGAPPSFRRHVISTAVGGPAAIAHADLDGDGDLDVISGSRRDNALQWHENLGGKPPRFADHRITAGDVVDPRFVAAADLDGDGCPDIVAAAVSGTRFSWWRNDGGSSPGFHEQVIVETEHPQGLGCVDLVDLDGDGDRDIVAAFYKRQRWHGEANRVLWFENDGRSPPAFTGHVVTLARNRPHTAFAADVDGDGILDVVTASRSDNTVAWYRRVLRDDATARRPR